jgi:hypothetical protein
LSVLNGGFQRLWKSTMSLTPARSAAAITAWQSGHAAGPRALAAGAVLFQECHARPQPDGEIGRRQPGRASADDGQVVGFGHV